MKYPISVITPWLDASELCPLYQRNVAEAQQVIVVDNASDLIHAEQIQEMVHQLGGDYIRNETNNLFAKANNQGLAVATQPVVLFINNDVECRPGFMAQVAADVLPGALYGPSIGNRFGYPYIEGWCIAGHADDWAALGGWDEVNYQGLYWEDNDLCFRAQELGLALKKTRWPIWHHANYTSNRIPGSKDHSAENMRTFLQRAQDVKKQKIQR